MRVATQCEVDGQANALPDSRDKIAFTPNEAEPEVEPVRVPRVIPVPEP